MIPLFNYASKTWEPTAEEEVRAKVLSGEYGVDANAKFPIIAPTGERYLFKGRDLYGAFQKGGTYGHKEEWDKLANKEEYGEGAVNQMLAGGAAFLRGGTLGLSDLALAPFAGKETLETLEESFPTTSAGLELTGGLMGLGKFKGAGIVSKAMRGATAPARKALEVGRAVEDRAKSLKSLAALSKGADVGLARKVIASGLPKAAGGIAEGAIWGTGAAINETLLGDPEDIGDILMPIAMGVVLGGTIPFGLNAAMIGVPGGAQKIGRGMASLWGKALDSNLSVKSEKWVADQITSAVGDTAADTVMKQHGWTKEWRKARMKEYGKRRGIREDAEKLGKNLDDTMNDMDEIRKASQGQGKHAGFRDAIFKDVQGAEEASYPLHTPEAAALKDEGTLIAKAIKVIRELFEGKDAEIRHGWMQAIAKGKGAPFTFAGKAAYQEQADLLVRAFSERHEGFTGASRAAAVKDWVLSVQKALEGADGAKATYAATKEMMKDAFLILDDYKKYAFPSSRYATTDTAVAAKSASTNMVDILRKPLENISIWGDAGRKQQIFNAKFSTYLKEKAGFEELFKKGTFAKGRRLDAQDISAFLDDATGDPRRLESLKKYMAAAKDFSETANIELGFSGEPLEASRRIIKVLENVNDITEKLVRDITAQKAIFGITGVDPVGSAMTGGIVDRMGQTVIRNIIYRSMRGTVGGGVLGGLAGGLPGVAAGAIFGNMLDSASRANTLAVIQSLTNKSSKMMDDKLTSLITKMTTGGPGGKAPPRSDVLRGFLAPLTKQSAEKEDKGKTKQDIYLDARERSVRFASPSSAADIAAKMAAPIREAAPSVAAALERKIPRALQIVADGFIPEDDGAQSALTGRPKRAPTDREIRKQEVRVAVLADPIGEVLSNLEAGTLTGTHSDALKEMYPNMHLALGAKLFSICTEAVADGKKLNREYLAQMSVMWGLPFDPRFEPQMIRTLQGNFTQEEDQGKVKPSPLIKTPGMGPTAVQQLMA